MNLVSWKSPPSCQLLTMGVLIKVSPSGGIRNINRETYYPWPLSPRPCTITTVERCSDRAGNTTGAGMLLNMAGRPTLEAIVVLLKPLLVPGFTLRKDLPLILGRMRNMEAALNLSFILFVQFVVHAKEVRLKVWGCLIKSLRKSVRIYGLGLMSARRGYIVQYTYSQLLGVRGSRAHNSFISSLTRQNC